MFIKSVSHAQGRALNGFARHKPVPRPCVMARVAHQDPIYTVQMESKVAVHREPANTAQFAAARRVLNIAISTAVGRQDYVTAAQLKRELDHINMEDPYYQLSQQLDACIMEQRYQDAAIIKAALEELEPTYNIVTHSEAVTNAIRVRAQSTYEPTESDPRQQQFFFSYTVTITNESDQVVQLRHRRWVFKDGTGKAEEVRGSGVVGVQPILLPGKSFSYDSGCPLPTPVGSMEGAFEMWVMSEEDGTFKHNFEARIGRFKLSAREE